MSVERYITEIPLTFDVSDECSVHWKVKYETYTASDADAETTARMFVSDMRKKLKYDELCFARDVYLEIHTND